MHDAAILTFIDVQNYANLKRHLKVESFTFKVQTSLMEPQTFVNK